MTGAVQAQYGYAYDLAGNRTLAQSGGVPANATFNALNELTALQTGGAGNLQVQGTVNKPVTGNIAIVNGTPRINLRREVTALHTRRSRGAPMYTAATPSRPSRTAR